MAPAPPGAFDFAVDPERDPPTAPVFWNPADAPAIVNLIAPAHQLDGNASSIGTLPVVASATDSEYTWLKLDNGAQLVAKSSAADSNFGIVVPFDDAWTVHLAAADRLYRQLRGLPVGHPLTRQRRQRLKHALRTVDGLRQGATYRMIAITYYGEQRVNDEPWKTNALKSQIARLAAYGRSMIDKGYRRLLQGKHR
ncbi:DUF2285 domain-containing protein [Pacificimonas sp. WHA3]|uniref:DUF2285 domain-containing protein n=1 Tax=Pacificimonas pallii TaxID=2827236 RepID=A0ABS6SDA0_9SPHN|nr:DUF2285 domain-containing protein [Pacificimonas pallii]MBV7255886.1 DUF2285 domain-containing protein [Pacificimonas pallii]